MIRVGLSALAILALGAPALADDPRLVETLYDPGKVVRIEGRTSVQATIAFAEDEHIENVAIGDSQSWQVTPNKRANLLFVKPLSPTATTNMTVVTDRHTYLFDLVASPRAKPLYVLRFTYPKEAESAKPHLADPGGTNALEAAAASDPDAVVDPAALNFAWVGKGERKLLPSRTYDDGEATFLAWPAGEPVPAILIKDAAGTEGPVNFTVRGDVVVIDGVPREIVLRSGRDSATLTNNGPLSAPRQSALAQSETSPKRENQ
jgi:type IV secretion system protein VirB9